MGRAKVGEMYDELAARPVEQNAAGPIPHLDTDSIKYEFQSEVMRRGAVSGEMDDGLLASENAKIAVDAILAG